MKTILYGTRYLFSCAAVLACASSAFAATGEASFTPTGLKFPIVRITLSKSNGSTGTAISSKDEQDLYKCPGLTSADCLVDLTSQADLDKISAAASSVGIRYGSYNQLALYSCPDGVVGGTHVSVWVKGEFTTTGDGTTYSTSATSANGLATTGSPDFAEISNWGCAIKVVVLPKQVEVTADKKHTPIDLTLLVDNTFLGNSTPNTSSGMGGCKVGPDGGRGICVNIPALLPYLGGGTTTTKRFKMSHNSVAAANIDDTKANAIVIVPQDGTTALTVFAGPYYTETSAQPSSNIYPPVDTVFGGPCYNTATAVETLTVKHDGSISFTQGGSGDGYSGVFSGFELADHTGTLTTQNGATWFYHAAPF